LIDEDRDRYGRRSTPGEVSIPHSLTPPTGAGAATGMGGVPLSSSYDDDRPSVSSIKGPFFSALSRPTLSELVRVVCCIVWSLILVGLCSEVPHSETPSDL
jgi:hypothetical protein